MKYLKLFEKFDQSEVDKILDKISDKGYDSLSKKEKDYLAGIYSDDVKEEPKQDKNMKQFSKQELQEKQDLINSLTFDVLESEPDFPEIDWDSDVKLWVEFHDEDGCLYDGGELTYYLQNDKIDGFREEVDGIFTYTGDLTKKELIDYLDKLGFEQS